MANVQLAIAGDETTQVILSVPGVQGPAGSNLPPSGTTNQVLYKQSNTDYDTAWKLLTNDNVDAAAAIAGTKISPNFGSQNAVTTGTSTAASFIPTSSSVPANGLYLPSANNVAISTSGAQRLVVDASGNVTFASDIVFGSGNKFTSSANVLSGPAGQAGAYIRSAVSSASNPSYAGADDTNTGIFIPGSDVLGFTTGGSERLRITNSGLVGVGTSNPTQKLDVADGDITLRKTTGGDTSGVTSQVLRIGTQSGDLACFYAISAGGGGPGGRGGDLYIQTKANNGSPTDRLVITEGGNVGIGTTNAVATLHSRADSAGSGSTPLLIQNRSVSANTAVGISFAPNTSDTADRSAIIYGVNSSGGSGNATDLTFHTNANGGSPSEKARIDSSGRLLVGTPSARSNFFNSSVSPLIQQEGISGSSRFMSVTYGTASEDDPIFIFGKHRGAAVGGNTVVANGDGLGKISFQGSDGSEFVEGVSIRAEVDGTPGANDMPGRLVFSTTADGAASPTERMRILSTGSVLFSTDTEASITSATANGHMWYESAQSWASSRSTTGGVSHFLFYNPNGIVGNIETSASSTSYNTSSDYRLKENVTAVTDGITRLQQLKPSRFNFVADPTKTVDGFIAHEAQAVVPECATGKKDAVDEDGNPVYQGIDQSKLVPLLTAALQEAVAKIESLEARLTAAGI